MQFFFSCSTRSSARQATTPLDMADSVLQLVACISDHGSSSKLIKLPWFAKGKSPSQPPLARRRSARNPQPATCSNLQTDCSVALRDAAPPIPSHYLLRDAMICHTRFGACEKPAPHGGQERQCTCFYQPKARGLVLGALIRVVVPAPCQQRELQVAVCHVQYEV